jgi:hypothetical protein
MLREAADDARRRGDGRHAVTLLEQAAEIAVDDDARFDCLGTAGWLALGRWAGDDALRLLLLLAEAARSAGAASVECEALLNAGEVARRFRGTVRRVVSDGELQSWCARAHGLVPAGDLRLRALAHAGQCWLDAATHRISDGQIEEALDLARRAGDPRVESLALDTATAHNWTNLRLASAAQYAAERRAVVQRLTDPLTVALETSDAFVMAADTAFFIGDLAGFRASADDVYAYEAPRGNYTIALARLLLLRFYDASWDEMVPLAERLQDGWAAAGRPMAVYAVPGVWALAAVARMRADRAGETRWTSFADAMSPGATRSHPWRDIYLADADLHLGLTGEAISRLDATPPITHQELQPLHTAVRAEAAVRDGAADAARLIEEAQPIVEANVLAGAVVRRAAAILAGDTDALRAVWQQQRAAGAIYQAARTAMYLGGIEEQDARETFRRLRVPAPARDRLPA